MLLGAACLSAQQQGSLEGTATNSLTHEPLANVHVRLIAADFNGINGAYGAMSDRAGHFSIASIRPGTYILLPERSGFLHVQSKNSGAVPNITIKAGEKVTQYELEMTPRAILSGRVVDESGDPVQGVRVQTVPAAPDAGPAIINPAPNPLTDDRGEFRITGPAGKFYVQAVLSQQMNNERPEVRSDGTSEAVYGTTFYPSTLRKDRGTVVEAIAGKEVGGLEIRLARQQGGLSISGVISGIPEGPSRPYVMLQWGEKAPIANSGRSVFTGPDGRFKIESLQPGFYRIAAVYMDGKTPMVSRTMEWTLENSDISNVELVLTPGIQVTGKVRMEGDAPGTPSPKRTVRLEPFMGFTPGNLQRSGGEVDAEGAFTITGAAPSRYKVGVEPLPEGAYVKAVEIDGAKGTDTSLDLSAATKGVTANILLGRNGVQVSGRVLDPNGERLQSNLVMIFLIREFEEVLDGMNGNGTTRAGADGKYTLKPFAPGKYRLFAVDALRISGGAVLDTFKDMFNRAEEVEFKEGERLTKDLRVMTKVDAREKK